MKAISHFSGQGTLRCGVLATLAMSAAWGQTLINLGTQGRNIDFSSAPATRPEKTGSSLPATCLAGYLFFNFTAPAGQNLYACVATNTWVPIGSGSGLADPGSNGLVLRTGLNTTAAVTAPTGTVVGTTDTQALTNKTVDGVSPATFGFLDATSSVQTQLNGKQAKLSFTGTGSKTVSATATGSSGHCAQWTAAGDIGDAGGACGTGSGGAVSTVDGVAPTSGNVALASTNLTDSSNLARLSDTSSQAFLGNVTAPNLLDDPGSNGVVVRTGSNTTTAVAAPAGAVVGTTDTQTLTNKTVDGVSPGTFGFLDATSSIQTQLNGKQATLSFTGTGSKTVSATAAGSSGHCAQWTAAGDIGDAGAACGTGGSATSPGGSNGQIQYNNAGALGGLSTIPAANMPAYTGDVTSAAGSTVNTLATVNSNVGTFGNATQCLTITVDAKGRITAAGQAACSGTTYTAGSGLTLTGTQFSLTSPIAGSFLPAYTGDVSSAAGSTVNTLATVNGTPGTFGSTTQCPTFTVNAKGLITAASQAACAGGGTGITQLTGDVTTPASSSGSTAATLATVNSTPGTFGSSTATPVITVNGKGLITAVTTAAISGTGGSSTATALTSGTLANLPSTCSAGSVYFATDQPAGQQLYTCSSANIWTQIASLGASGALAYTNGSLDIVTSVVPRLTAFNTFSGLDAFSNGLQLTTSAAGQPSCTSTTRGLFWYQNNGASKDGLQICVYNGTSYAWISLY